ncbi:MAG: NUDIX domain-containing protein, partial [Bryobacteraceae bacterium]
MKLISSTEITHTPIFRVTRDRAIDPDGFEIERAIVQHGGSAVMMPVDDRKRILLVRQYRLPARRYTWELPAGRVDEGETPLQAARRNVYLEINASPERLDLNSTLVRTAKAKGCKFVISTDA